MSGFDLPPGDPPAILAAADLLERHAGDAGDLGTTTLRRTEDIRSGASWSGPAADSYTSFTTGVAQGIRQLEVPLSTISSDLRAYAAVLKTAQDQIRSAWQTAQSAAHLAATDGEAIVGGAEADADRAREAVRTAAETAMHSIEGLGEQLARAWEASEPVRSWIERVKAPWDLLAVDAAVGVAIKHGEAPEQFARAMDGLLRADFSNDVGALAHEADNGLVDWSTVDAAATRWASKADAVEAFSRQWMGDTRVLRGATPALRGLSRVAGGTAVLGDVATLIKPEDSGVMGGVDRTAAGVNGTLVALDLAGAEIPVAGEVLIVGTGIYLGGDYLYHHWKPFHDVCDTVGHATVTAVKDTGHAIGSAAKTVGGWLGL